jgi:DNA-binding NtrC family response regulator
MKNTLPQLLVVDDDGDFCTIIANNLADIFNIQSVPNITQALEQLKNVPPDVMILDNYLPDGLGAKYIAVCKKSNPSLRIIMVSADADQMLKRETMEAGASLFLLKPFSMETLRRSIYGVIN